MQQHFHRAYALVHYACGFGKVSVFGIKMPQGGKLALGEQRPCLLPDALSLFTGDQLTAGIGVGGSVHVL